jgi:hypothetical protein
MKKTTETKQDGKEFERFDEFLTELVKVPKDVILKREKEEKERNRAKKAKKT